MGGGDSSAPDSSASVGGDMVEKGFVESSTRKSIKIRLNQKKRKMILAYCKELQ